ncbi:type IX secretion system membrane protein PorP/SprF [Myroides odoratimimus]|uniref:PorP/SprF family type IX secretion system membrane protein n=1 Tax=Myroides odoratimimus TaxID=76832 RepID=UPI0025753CBD|nr:type IX secretion system membrane protein PorP/SprF [Myroides odoratimimus]MDM1414404.1 type IX secretion system membrane protein PorP/SprF [Myroides odoratimimus]MDM1446715.1 type IX secretion system membrane protein PorP/SprF [Myroides odoratimimus]MEC4007961.1 type IX secretion system membrane protein PorP/SprF [Myroides odoratimimus]MEC4076020.1 type IX secretion system membrane protein PorP/SprF [Myroides odoratimimus]
MTINRTIRNISVCMLTLLGAQQMQAQQDPQYTQYMYNTSNINPAYAGTRGNLSIFGNYRTQWVGLDGAPKTANLSVSTPLGDSGLGLGVNYMNDRIGAMDENNISVDLSYAIDVNQDYKLAFGLKATANLLNVDYTRLNIYSGKDPVAMTNIDNQFSPNIGAGLYLYSEKSYLGLSVPNFLITDRYDDNEVTTMRQKAHFYLMGGYVFELNPSLKFKPAFLAKAVSGAPLQMDLTANFLIIDKFTVGAAYRWDASVSALAGFQVNDNLFVGYSYDADTTKLANYNSGSHEIFLRFDLFNNRTRMNTPRFF